jgi:sarcosine oxidase subunit gamma
LSWPGEDPAIHSGGGPSRVTMTWLRQSPLAHRNLLARAGEAGSAGVRLCERPQRCMVELRGEPGELGGRLGFALPEANQTARHDSATILWLGPDQWLWVGEHAREWPSDVPTLDVGDARAVLGLAGPKARALLARACPLDLHPAAFGPGRCAQTTLARTTMLLHLLSDDAEGGPVFDVYVARSYADYAWTWLERAGAQFGVAVVEA